jgi:hypothetical protein
MPFSGQAYPFNEATLNRVNEVGGVYGLFAQTAPNYYVARYVGLGENLRRRLREHFNNPPTTGITHFFVEGHPTAIARVERERALIREFNPPGNVHHTR